MSDTISTAPGVRVAKRVLGERRQQLEPSDRLGRHSRTLPEDLRALGVGRHPVSHRAQRQSTRRLPQRRDGIVPERVNISQCMP